eukprot:6183876-Pleurochrysis_carterae.AAC.1
MMLRGERRDATTLQERLGVRLNQADKQQAVEQGTLSGRLGNSATSAEAELLLYLHYLKRCKHNKLEAIMKMEGLGS